jgi:hypothetical protein
VGDSENPAFERTVNTAKEAEILHAHPPTPFQNLNNLAVLIRLERHLSGNIIQFAVNDVLIGAKLAKPSPTE